MQTEGHDLPIVLSFYAVLYRGTHNTRNNFSVTCAVVFKRQRDAFGDTNNLTNFLRHYQRTGSFPLHCAFILYTSNTYFLS